MKRICIIIISAVLLAPSSVLLLLSSPAEQTPSEQKANIQQFAVELTPEELKEYQGSTIVFILDSSGDVRKFMLAAQTYAEFESLKKRLSTASQSLADVVPPKSFELGSARSAALDPQLVKGIDVRWTPLTDRRNLEMMMRGCKDMKCQYPCLYHTCTCAFSDACR